MRYLRKSIKLFAVLFVMLTFCALPYLKVEAGTIYDSPHVAFAPDGLAWTTCRGDTHNGYYENGYTIHTGIESELREVETGEHYYKYTRTGHIPVGNWVVAHENARCIHDEIDPNMDYHGIVYGPTTCGTDYTQGWLAYCADCHQRIADILMYMCEDAAESITYIPTGMDYYYCCPHCAHLEQGVMVSAHICEKISWNRYTVDYRVNTSEEYIGFEPEDTYHMYNNASEYEGNLVTPNTRLAKMNVKVPGYEFVGWNTKADGSGTWYEDEAEIYNLTEYDSKYDVRGTVILFAQWKRSESTLQIDPSGGTYLGNLGITSYTKYAYDTQELYPDRISAPDGATLRFQVNGGIAIAPITVSQHFERWEAPEAFGGSLVGNIYHFPEKNGTVDRLTVVYAPDAVTLPEARKENASFGGWYYNEECTFPAGGAGDRITIDADTTLYARWVELSLSSVENYIANHGKGAVDLSWSQPDTYQKSYRLYRYVSIGENDVPWMDMSAWTLINETLVEGVDLKAAENAVFSGTSQTYVVPYTGVYTLTAVGAQGGNCGIFKGGLGGEVKGSFWLNAGDTVTYTVGGQNGYNGGGTASAYGNGGGATLVTSSERGLLLVAAGGGGATQVSNGGNGGETLSVNLLTDGYSGENGMAGGGGGYRGGKAGEYIYHSHTVETCGYHKHEGNVISGGECYTALAEEGTCSPERRALADEATWECGKCGGTITQHHYYAGGSCEADNVMEGKTRHDYWNAWCDGTCGYSESYGLEAHTYVYMVYTFTCTTEKGYQCGKSDTIPESSKPAYGGSSYVNTALCTNYAYNHGSNEGNGYFTILSENIGFMNGLEAEGVPAPDLAAPEAVAESTVVFTPIADGGGSKITVSWGGPKDNGTDYYFMVESHRATTGEKLATSNIRMHTLITGVKGYYCAVNTSREYHISAGNAAYQDNSQMQVTLNDITQYLHVAPVDAAGNVGDTLTINLGNISGEGEQPDDVIPWPVYTEQMRIVQRDGVCEAEERNTYYVRCDNATPFELSFRAYMEGAATEQYQITHVTFHSQQEGALAAKHTIITPLHTISDREIITNGSGLITTTEGIPVLKRYLYTATTKSNRNKDLLVVSQFLIGEEAHGKTVRVTPGASVETEKSSVSSDEAVDLSHSIYLIGDANAPDVQGTDILESESLIDRGGSEVVLQLSATDELSGLDSFYVEIFNEDSGGSRTYSSDRDGNITLNLTEETSLFAGDFTVTIVAVDKVGNVWREMYYVTELGLETEVERILAPHEPAFKRGESGILTVATWGHVDRVEVEFPDRLTEYNETYEYVRTQYKTGEIIQFMIPLYGIADGDYEINVRAYKGAEQLGDVKKIYVSRTVLDELRTRLR